MESWKSNSPSLHYSTTPLLRHFVPSHFLIHFFCPGINAAPQTADVLQTMAHEISCGIEPLSALVVDDHQWTAVRAFGHDFAHALLGQHHRAFDMPGLNFLAPPN